MYEIRERPLCRKAILRLGLRPNLDARGEWDGRTALRGTELLRITDGMKKQMRLMVAEGRWGEVKLAKRHREPRWW